MPEPTTLPIRPPVEFTQGAIAGVASKAKAVNEQHDQAAAAAIPTPPAPGAPAPGATPPAKEKP